MRNSVVELVASRSRLEVLLINVPGEKEMHWVNGQPVSRLYKCESCCFPNPDPAPAFSIMQSLIWMVEAVGRRRMQ